jgi:hypothetical protein
MVKAVVATALALSRHRRSVFQAVMILLKRALSPGSKGSAISPVFSPRSFVAA